MSKVQNDDLKMLYAAMERFKNNNATLEDCCFLGFVSTQINAWQSKQVSYAEKKIGEDLVAAEKRLSLIAAPYNAACQEVEDLRHKIREFD